MIKNIFLTQTSEKGELFSLLGKSQQETEILKLAFMLPFSVFLTSDQV